MSRKQGSMVSLYIMLRFFILLFLVAIVFAGFAILGSSQYGHQQETICDRYINEYKINATFEKTFMSGQCYVYTTEGIKIRENDFNLASVIEVQRLK